MTIREFQKDYNYVEIDLLLVQVLKKTKEFLYMEPEYELTSKQFSNLTKLIKRRENGEPLAYVLGYKDFCGLRFKVNKDVLIPRPETEELVQKLLIMSSRLSLSASEDERRDLLQKSKTKLRDFSAQMHSLGMTRFRILDVGTGSGCIAVSLAKLLPKSKHPNIQISASDISPSALFVAKQNAKNHKVKIKFIQSDLFAKINGKFDIITANLPYIPLKILHKFLHHKTKLNFDDPFKGLKFEPPFALTDGTSSFQIYRRFFEQVKNHINSHSVILLETDPSSKKFLIEYQKKHLPGWQMKFYKDANGLMRFVEIKK